MNRRLLLVLALGAALVGAPSPVSAASNALRSPQVSPTSGTTDTTFTFSVRYEGRFPAGTITAIAGPATISLTLAAGTPTDGTWRGSGRLPAGTWPVAFAAVADQGNPASAEGPIVTVLPDSPAVAAPSAWPPASGAGGTGTTATPSGAGGATATSPPAVVAPVQPTAPPAQTPVAAPGETPVSAPRDQRPAPPPPVGGTPSNPATPGGAPGAPSGEDAELGAARAGSPTPTPLAASPAGGAGGDAGGLALVLGLAGLALVAVSGSAILLVAGRRRRSAATSEGPAVEPASAARVVERRAVRRARMRLDEDPIVAAMGLSDGDSAAERRVRRTPRKDRAR